MPSTAAAIITPALPAISKYYNLQNANVNLIVSIFLLGFMSGQLIFPQLSDHIGRVKSVQVGFGFNLIGIIISSLSVHIRYIEILDFGRFISGFGSAAALVCVITIINELFDEANAKKLLSFSIFSFVLGINLGVFFSGYIVTYIGWQYVFVLLLIQGIIMLFLSFFIKDTFIFDKNIILKKSSFFRGYKEVFLNKQFLCFAFILSLSSVISYGYSAEGPIIAYTKLNIVGSKYGEWNMLNAGGMLLGALLSAKLVKTIRGLLLIDIGFVLIAFSGVSLLFMLIIKSHSAIWFFSTTSLSFCSLGFIFPSATYYASNACIDKSKASGAMNFIALTIASLIVSLMGYMKGDCLLIFLITLFSILFMVVIFFKKVSSSRIFTEINSPKKL